MISERQRYNVLVQKYNNLLRSQTLNNQERSKEKEIHNSVEGITISEDSITLQSSFTNIEELSALMIKLLNDKTIKNFFGTMKVKKLKKEMLHYAG